MIGIFLSIAKENPFSSCQKIKTMSGSSSSSFSCIHLRLAMFSNPIICKKYRKQTVHSLMQQEPKHSNKCCSFLMRRIISCCIPRWIIRKNSIRQWGHCPRRSQLKWCLGAEVPTRSGITLQKSAIKLYHLSGEACMRTISLKKKSTRKCYSLYNPMHHLDLC